MQPTCFQIDPHDNVATLLDDGPAGVSARLVGGGGEGTVLLGEAIARGHKVALADLAPGDAILKYGIRIGHASRAIRRGQWVHLQNCASNLDVRSATLDPQTGAPLDVKYE